MPHTSRAMEPKALCIILAAQAEYSPKALPLGAACVVSALKADEALSGRLDARVVSALPGEAPEAFAQRVAAEAPAFVGFSLYVWNRPFLEETARALRSRLPAARFFAGGPEVNAAPGSFAPGSPFGSILCGDGESSAPMLLKALLEGGEAPFLVRGESLPPDRLSSPWLDGSLAALERGGALWELARGCPFSCSYCYESKGSKRVRALPTERLRRELGIFVRAGVDQVSVLDPTFNSDRERAKALLELIEEEGEGIYFSFEARAEFLDREQARRFASIPCSVQIGLQSADPEVMRALGRPFDPELFARKVRLLDEAGAVYGLDLMYGLPGDSHQGFLKSLSFALGLRPNHLDIFRLAVLPGTELAERADGLGLERQSEPPYLALGSPGYPGADIEKSASFARAVEVFYNRGRAVPWFGALATAAGLSYGALIAEVETALRLRKDSGALGEVDPDGVYDHSRIEDFQLDFAESLLVHRGRAECVDALSDLIRLHGAYSRALAEGQESVVSLNYDPDAVLSPAGLDPRAFARGNKKRPSRAWIGRDEDGEVDLRPMKERKEDASQRGPGGARPHSGGKRDDAGKGNRRPR